MSFLLFQPACSKSTSFPADDWRQYTSQTRFTPSVYNKPDMSLNDSLPFKKSDKTHLPKLPSNRTRHFFRPF